MYKILHVHIFSFLLDIDLGVDMLSNIVNICWLIGKLPRCFQSGCTTSHFHKLCMRAPFFSHLWQHLLLSIFYIFSTIAGMKSYLTAVLIFIFLITSDSEYLFLCLSAILLWRKAYSSPSLIFNYTVVFLFTCWV